MRRRLLVLVLVVFGAAVLSIAPARAQTDGEGTCDPAIDPGCETVPCEPGVDPECSGGGGEPGCDPETDPNCVGGEPGCDPETDPDGCEVPPCDPEVDPECIEPEPGCDPETDPNGCEIPPECDQPEGCEVPPCDPEVDPECIEPEPGCDPETDPDGCEIPPECDQPEGCEVPPCDPEVDPECIEPEPGCNPETHPDGCEVPVCDPVTGDGCDDYAIPAPEHSQFDPDCVYEYDADGFGQCTNGELHCEFQPFTDGSGMGLEACVLPDVILGPGGIESESGGSATSGGSIATGGVDTERGAGADGPDTLPQTGAPLRSLVLTALLLLVAGAVVTAGASASRRSRPT